MRSKYTRRNEKVRGLYTLIEGGGLTFSVELMDLKKRWEEDKAKVEKLKESRRFRPY